MPLQGTVRQKEIERQLISDYAALRGMEAIFYPDETYPVDACIVSDEIVGGGRGKQVRSVIEVKGRERYSFDSFPTLIIDVSKFVAGLQEVRYSFADFRIIGYWEGCGTVAEYIVKPDDVLLPEWFDRRLVKRNAFDDDVVLHLPLTRFTKLPLTIPTV